MPTCSTLVGLALAALAPGCGGDHGRQPDAAAVDAPAGPDAGPLPDFPLRTPATHTLACPNGDQSFRDVDWVCRIPVDGRSIDLYVQATPTSCAASGLSATPVFGDVAAWYKVAGAGQAVPTAAAYEWGGNHHNDQIKFAYQGTINDLWHSSIGFGWRACAPPDCLLACDAGATFGTCDYLSGWTVDGCARSSGAPPPPAPVICVAVNGDGSLPPLVDPWTAHPPLLPCLGD